MCFAKNVHNNKNQFNLLWIIENYLIDVAEKHEKKTKAPKIQEKRKEKNLRDVKRETKNISQQNTHTQSDLFAFDKF